MTKEEKIIEVYGEHWPALAPFHTEEGWLLDFEMTMEARSALFLLLSEGKLENPVNNTEGGDLWRHVDLDGIQHNNGWHAINGPEDLPKANGQYRTINRSGKIVTFYRNAKSAEDRNLWLQAFTHWKPIPEEKLPIY